MTRPFERLGRGHQNRNGSQGRTACLPQFVVTRSVIRLFRGMGWGSSAFPSEPLSLMPSRSRPMVLCQGGEAPA